MNKARLFTWLACWAFATVAAAEPDAEVERLRHELEQLKTDYEQRLQQLEQRLQTLKGQAEQPAGTATVATDPSSKNALPAGAERRSFNPAISLILDGKLTSFANSPEDYALAGFQLGEEAGLGEEGFSVQHSELVISANVDDLFYAQLTAAIAEHDGHTELELEEAYFETLALGHGLQLRGGRFFSGLGYLNQQHAHAWDFADAPLVYRALFANQLNDDGVQLTWVAPSDLFMQFGAEWLRGGDFPAAGSPHGGAGAGTVFAKLGGDLGVSHSWQLGLSHWRGDVDNRASAGHEHEGAAAAVSFSGDSRISALDLVWKWAPHGNAKRTNFKFQGEYFRRHEQGEVSIAEDPIETTSYDGVQKGWYAQAVYQFMPRWRVGARYDHLQANNRASDPEVLAEAGLDGSAHDPQRYAIMLDYSRSEFSRIRLQYNRDESRPERDDQLYLQFIMSLGAHGAHAF